VIRRFERLLMQQVVSEEAIAVVAGKDLTTTCKQTLYLNPYYVNANTEPAKLNTDTQ